jgi:hypothetical protein
MFGVDQVFPPGKPAKREAVSASVRRLTTAPSQVAQSPVVMLLAAPRSSSSAIPGGGGGLDCVFKILTRVLSVICRDVVLICNIELWHISNFFTPDRCVVFNI